MIRRFDFPNADLFRAIVEKVGLCLIGLGKEWRLVIDGSRVLIVEQFHRYGRILRQRL